MFRFALKVFPFPCYAITAGPTRNPARVIHCQSRLFVRSSTLTFASNWPVRSLSSPFFPFFSTTIDSRARLRGSNYARKRRGGSKGEERKKLKEGMAACTHFEKFTEISQTPRRKAQLLPPPLARPLLLFSHGHARNGFRVYYSWWWCKVALASMSIALMEIGTIARGIFPTIARTHS